MDLLFDEITHKYYFDGFKDNPLTSVSAVLGSLKEGFDSEKVATDYAAKGKDYVIADLQKKWKLTKKEAFDKWGHLEMNKGDILSIWQEKNNNSTAKGSAAHLLLEKSDLSVSAQKGYVEVGDLKKSLDIASLSPGVYTELIIPFAQSWLIGTADKIIIYEDMFFDIKDYKTNETLPFKGTAYFNKKKGYKEVKKLKAPLSHLDSVDGIIYTLQLSLYSYFLESYGYKFRSAEIIHVECDYKDGVVDIKKQTPIEIPYMKKEVEVILKHWKFLQSKKKK